MKTIFFNRTATVAALALATQLLAPLASTAADGTWTNSATGAFNWADAVNWSAATVADGADATAYFNTVDVPTGGITVNVDTGRTIGNLVFGDITGSQPYNLSGDVLTLSVSSGNSLINVTNAGQSVTASNQLVSYNTIEKTGAGALLLRSNVTQEVKWVISKGVVDIAYPFGNAMSANFGSYTPDAITLDGGTLRMSYLFYSVANLGFTMGPSGGTIDVGSTTCVLDNNYMAFTGPGSFTKTGSGTLQLRAGFNQNDYSGDTIIAAGSLILRYNDDVIPNGPGKGNVIINNGATLDLSGRNDTINGLNGGGVVDNSSVNQSYDCALTMGDNDANGTFTGLIGNSGSKRLSIAKTGAGTQTLSGANTYTGSTTVNAGALNVTTASANADYTVNATLGVTAVSAVNSLGVSNLTLNSGAVLNFGFGTNINPTVSAISAATDLNLNDVVTVNVSGVNLSVGSVTLLQYAGSKTGAGSFTLGTLPAGMSATLADNTGTAAKNLVLNITSVGYYLTYVAATNGTISGSTNQLVALGGNGTSVTAVANAGFRFSRWNDGRTNAARLDTNVTLSATYTAYFVSTNAMDGIWTQTATGTQTWATAGNWSGGIVATNIDAVANFSTINVPSGGQTVAVDAGRTVGSLLLGDSSGSDAYTFNGSALTLAVSSGNAGIVSANASQSCTFSNVISSSNLIEKSGSGLINLRANATQVQKWLISGGTVNFDQSTRLTLNPASFTADAITLNGGTLQLNFLFLNNANMGITLGAAGGTINSPSGTSSLDNNASYITGPGSLTKAGAGILNFRPNGNTYAGDTIIAAGTLKLNFYDNCIPDGAGKGNLIINSGATFDLGDRQETINGLSGSGIVDNSGTTANSTLTIGNNNTSSTFNGILRNSSASKFLNLTKTGSGIINLLGVNTNKGSMTINAGALYVSTTSSNGSYSVASGATLGVVCGDTNSALGMTNLTFVNSSTLAVNLGSAGNPVNSIINAAGNLAVTNTVTVNIYGSHLQTGTITLLTFAGTKSGSGTFALGPLPPGMAATLTDNTSAGSKNLLLNITAVPTQQDIRWAVGIGYWDITTANWQIISNSAPSTYLDDYTVLFNDNNSSTTNLITVSLAQNVMPVAMTVSNNTKGYVFSGAYGITGSTGLSKQGTGTVTVATANLYSGATTIGGGTVKLAVASALPAASSVLMNPASGTAKLDLAGFNDGINGLNSSGAGASIVDNSTGTATLTVGNNGADGVFGGSIRNSAGTLNLTKAGAGILNLTASNSYSGKTILTGGTLVINSKDSLGATPASLTSDQLTLGATTGSTAVTLSNTTSITFADVNRGVTVRDSGAFLDASINTPAGTTLTIAGSLSATASGTAVGLQKAGTGVLVLSNAASYNATLQLDAGTVQFNSALNSGIFLKNMGLVILGGGDYTAGIGFGGGLHQLYGTAGYAAVGADRTVALGGGIVTWGDANFAPSTLILGAAQATHTLIFSSSINLNGATRTIQADDGAAAVDGRLTGVLTNGALTKIGNGTLQLSAANVYAGATTVSAGRLSLASTGAINSSTNVTVGSGAIFDVSAVSGFTIGAAQVLNGSGAVVGNTTVNGTLAPGNSIGALTFSNNLTLAGNTVMELDKSLSPSNDLAVVTGQLAYGGTLTLNNIGTNALVAGDSFKLFQPGSIAGNFATIAGSPGAGLAWSFNASSGVASVVTTGSPTLTLTPSAGGVLNFSWPGSGYKLQSQTNSLSAGLRTNWFDYPGGAASPVAVTNNPANPSVFFRLISL